MYIYIYIYNFLYTIQIHMYVCIYIYIYEDSYAQEKALAMDTATWTKSLMDMKQGATRLGEAFLEISKSV